MRRLPINRTGVVLSFCVLASLVCRLSASSPVCAADQRYSLGTVQEEASLEVEAGGEVSTTIAFYNIDGTVPVHVNVSLYNVPDGWDVRLVPACADSAVVSPHSEEALTLRLEPMQLFLERPECRLPCTKRYWLPERGYVCALPIILHVSVPQERASKHVTLGVRVIATWDGSTNAIPQERDLVYDVTIVSAGGRDWLPFGHVFLAIAVAASVLALFRWHLVKSSVI
ncbi:MAG TPA: hypothetical protein ENL12_00175 [Dehalococcoidia bacterium]|nr:hypothetical protein [Dehalococcoidia bacterium]